MIKTNDWIKSGTSNKGDDTHYTIRGGWFMSYTKSLGEVSVRAPDGTFKILDTDEPVTSVIAAKRLAANFFNRGFNQ